MTGQISSAMKGRGAHCNGAKITPSALSKLDQAVVSFVRGHEAQLGPLVTQAKELEQLLEENFRRVIRTWAPSLDWCLLAKGGIDVLVSYESETEDQLAGALIAQEALVQVTDFQGQTYRDGTRRIMAATPLLFEPLLKLLSGFNPR